MRTIQLLSRDDPRIKSHDIISLDVPTALVCGYHEQRFTLTITPFTVRRCGRQKLLEYSLSSPSYALGEADVCSIRKEAQYVHRKLRATYWNFQHQKVTCPLPPSPSTSPEPSPPPPPSLPPLPSPPPAGLEPHTSSSANKLPGETSEQQPKPVPIYCRDATQIANAVLCGARCLAEVGTWDLSWTVQLELVRTTGATTVVDLWTAWDHYAQLNKSHALQAEYLAGNAELLRKACHAPLPKNADGKTCDEHRRRYQSRFATFINGLAHGLKSDTNTSIIEVILISLAVSRRVTPEDFARWTKPRITKVGSEVIDILSRHESVWIWFRGNGYFDPVRFCCIGVISGQYEHVRTTLGLPAQQPTASLPVNLQRNALHDTGTRSEVNTFGYGPSAFGSTQIPASGPSSLGGTPFGWSLESSWAFNPELGDQVYNDLFNNAPSLTGMS